MTETTAAVQVGGNVRAELARAGKTQAWLADAIGISQQSVSDRLRGKSPFDVNELARVADALGLDAASLMSVTVSSAQAS